MKQKLMALGFVLSSPFIVIGAAAAEGLVPRPEVIRKHLENIAPTVKSSGTESPVDLGSFDDSERADFEAIFKNTSQAYETNVTRTHVLVRVLYFMDRMILKRTSSKSAPAFPLVANFANDNRRVTELLKDLGVLEGPLASGTGEHFANMSELTGMTHTIVGQDQFGPIVEVTLHTKSGQFALDFGPTGTMLRDYCLDKVTCESSTPSFRMQRKKDPAAAQNGVIPTWIELNTFSKNTFHGKQEIKKNVLGKDLNVRLDWNVEVRFIRIYDQNNTIQISWGSDDHKQNEEAKRVLSPTVHE
jgi:hypothetical protein